MINKETYKRLTETLNHYINGKPCKPYGHCLTDCNKQMSFINPERKANGCGECQHFEKVLTRLAELEDKIENGTLVPRYSILKDWQYGWWCVCEVDEQSRIIAQCKTEEEAKRKLEELER